MEDKICNIPQQILCERRLSTIEEHLKNQDDKLDKILAQTQKTNGRVNKLEEWKAVVKSNIALIGAGIAAIISTGVSIVISMIGK